MTTLRRLTAGPYVGPRPYRRGEQLFGRDCETQELVDLIRANRIVLLHSPSGAGKTSLIQAALVPALIRNRFRPLPIIRVSREPSSEDWAAPRGVNRYV